jgi:hypothetical protein
MEYNHLEGFDSLRKQQKTGSALNGKTLGEMLSNCDEFFKEGGVWHRYLAQDAILVVGDEVSRSKTPFNNFWFCRCSPGQYQICPNEIRLRAPDQIGPFIGFNYLYDVIPLVDVTQETRELDPAFPFESDELITGSGIKSRIDLVRGINPVVAFANLWREGKNLSVFYQLKEVKGNILFSGTLDLQS